jgi:hypothetical protein
MSQNTDSLKLFIGNEKTNLTATQEFIIEETIKENESMQKALMLISAIEDQEQGGDWDEIEEARNIADKALSELS